MSLSRPGRAPGWYPIPPTSGYPVKIIRDGPQAVGQLTKRFDSGVEFSMAEDTQRTINTPPDKNKRPYSVLEITLFMVLPIVGTIILCAYLYGAVSTARNDNWCANELSETVYSPDNKYMAVSFLQNCGATEAYNPGVSILLANDQFTDTKTDGIVFLCYRCGCTNVSWQSDRKLLIDYCWPEPTGLKFESPDDFLKIQEKHIHDVDISLQLVEEK